VCCEGLGVRSRSDAARLLIFVAACWLVWIGLLIRLIVVMVAGWVGWGRLSGSPQ